MDPAAPQTGDVTRLLQEGASGELVPLVYEQLRAIAQRAIADERPGHTLSATALVHEAYIRLVGAQEVPWSGRAHFYGAAAEAMRRILVDHARARSAHKRGGTARRLDLSSVLDLAAADDPEQIVAFDEAVLRLEQEDAHAAAIVRLRFYAGLSVSETALALGISPRAVDRGWAYARARLWRALAPRPT